MEAAGVGQPGSVHEREAEYYDRKAGTLDPAHMPPGEPDIYERMLFESAGDLRGKRVLDLGCGDGGITLQLLARGADVEAVDISAGMVEVTRARAQRFFPDASATIRVAPVEATGVPAGSIDIAVGKWILHHVDVRAVGEELARVLKPGGVGVFFENHFRNPLLELGRNRFVGRFGIPRLGTEDEHPLTDADYEIWRSMFSTVELEYPDFHFFELFNRQLLKYRNRRMNRLSRGLDELIWRRLPRLRPYSYHLIVRLTK